MSTTGTKSGSGDFSGLNDAMKIVYGPSMAVNIEGESEVSDAFTDAGDFEVTEGSDGKQINLGLYMSAGGGFSGMNEDDYLPDNIAPVWKQGVLNIPQLAIRVDLSGRALRRVKEGPAAFATWADVALTEKAKRFAFHKDRMLLGTGTGIVGAINGAPDGTADAIDTAFGISGLEGAINLFLTGDSLRYSPNADGSSPRTGRVDVANIDYAANSGAGAFDTTVSGSTATATSAADNDYVFVGGTNVYGAGKETMGLEGIVDDGTNISTFQGLTRSSYKSTLNAQIVDSTGYTGAPSGVLSEDLIDYGDTLAYERAGGKPDFLLGNRNGLRSFWKNLRADRRINDPQGQYTGGKRKSGLVMLLGDREVGLRAARKVPSSRAFLLERATLKRFQIGAGRWDDITGSIWNRVTDSTGAKDAVFAVYIEEFQVGCMFPARNVKFTKIAAA